MPKNPKYKRNVSNLGVIPENLNQKEGIESGRDAGEHEIKRNGSNLGAMPEKSKQN